MKLLLVGAGAEASIKDVETGYREAFADLGVETRYYNLAARIGVARQWVTRLWRMRGAVDEQRPTWPEAIYRASVEALEMALRYEVDWMLVVSGMFLHPDALILCARAGVRTAIILTESPYEDERQGRLASLADMVWTNERTSVDRLRLAAPHVRYLRGAYSPTRHSPSIGVDDDVPSHEVVFVGTGWRERIDLLQAVDWDGIDLGLYGEWALLGSRSKLRDFVRGPTISNARTVELYRRARVGLNLFRTSVTYGQRAPRIALAESMNPRAYELPATGVFQLSEYRAEVRETFGPCVPTFNTAQELESLLRQALADDTARHDCAELARELVAPHTFAARAAQVLADLEQFESALSHPHTGTPAVAGLKGA